MGGEKDATAEMPTRDDIARIVFDCRIFSDVGHTCADRILALFAPILAERDEARADLAKLMDPELKHLRIEGGAIDLALTGPIVQHMGLVISEHFRASGAENYIEMTYHAKTEPFETYVWTIQKRVGSNSPHDLRAAAEARALAAEAALAAERERCAKIAESAKSYDDNLQRSAGCATTGQRIAAAIPAQGE